jgi:hypothetical protein
MALRGSWRKPVVKRLCRTGRPWFERCDATASHISRELVHKLRVLSSHPLGGWSGSAPAADKSRRQRRRCVPSSSAFCSGRARTMALGGPSMRNRPHGVGTGAWGIGRQESGDLERSPLLKCKLFNEILQRNCARGDSLSLGRILLLNLLGLDAAGANAHLATLAIHTGVNGLQVGKEATLRMVVGVADIVPTHGALAADLAHSAHPDPHLRCLERVRRRHSHRPPAPTSPVQEC